MKIKLMIAVICAAQVSLFASEKELKTFPAKDVKKTEIFTETGSIAVTWAPAGDAEVTVSDNDAEKCSVTIKSEGGKLFLRAEKRMKYFGKNCPASFMVKLPENIPLKAASGTGGVALNGLSGEVSAELGTGSVSGELRSADIKIKSGTGSVNLSGLRGDAKVETGKGSVELRWSFAPKTGKVKAVTGMGGITLMFPPDAKISAELKTSLGSPSNEFPAAAGGLKVSASSGMGSVSVLKTGK